MSKVTEDVQQGELLKAAVNAAALLDAIFLHLKHVNAAGGANSISGIAACNTMLKSLNSNRSRVEKLVMAPLRQAIAREQGQ